MMSERLVFDCSTEIADGFEKRLSVSWLERERSASRERISPAEPYGMHSIAMTNRYYSYSLERSF